MIAIAYKKDYSTSCRGCTMERYGSDFNMHHFTKEEDAIEWCANLDGTTRFEQDKDAWDFYFIEDGFEKRVQADQYFDPEIDGEWTSQGNAECFFQPSEALEKIKVRGEEIYTTLVRNEKSRKEDEAKRYEAARLAKDIENAKKLLEQHPGK